MRVWAIVNVNASVDRPLGEAVDVFLDRQDAEWFLEEVRIVERELNVDPSPN